MAMARSLLFLCIFAVWVQVESRPTPGGWDATYNYAGAEHTFDGNNFGDSSHVNDFSFSNLESEFRSKNPSSFRLSEEFAYGSGANNKYSKADSSRFSTDLYNVDRQVSRDEQFQTLYSYNPEQLSDESRVDEPRMSSFDVNRFESSVDSGGIFTDQGSFASRETYRFDATTTESNFGDDASTYALLASDFSHDVSSSFERAAPERRFGDVSDEHFSDASTYTFDASRFSNYSSVPVLAESPVSFDYSDEHFGDASTSSLPSEFTRAPPPTGFDANEEEFSGAVAETFPLENSAFEVAQAPVADFNAGEANFSDVSSSNSSETELAPWSYDAITDESTTRTFQRAEAPESFQVESSENTTRIGNISRGDSTMASQTESPAPESFDFSEVSFNAEYARVVPKQNQAEAPESDDSSKYTIPLTNVTSEAAAAPGSSEESNFQEFSTETIMSNDSRSNTEDNETFADVSSHSLSSSESFVKDSEVTSSDSVTLTMPTSFSHEDSSSHQMFAHTTFNSKPLHTFERADGAP